MKPWVLINREKDPWKQPMAVECELCHSLCVSEEALRNHLEWHAGLGALKEAREAADQDLGTTTPKRTGIMQVTLWDGGKGEPLKYAEDEPSAAQVIAAAERALIEIREVLAFPDETIWLSEDGYLVNSGYPDDDETRWKAAQLDDALAEIAKWKEGK